MEYVKLIQDLIRTCPVSSDVNAVNKASGMLFDFLRGKGLFCTKETWNGRTIVYASVKQEKTPDFLMNAHLDVVPPSEEGQFEPVIKDGWMIGRGTGDCIGNAVCIAKVLCELDKGVSAGAIFSADEEIGGKTTHYMVEHGYSAKKMICVMDHWDNGKITYAQKGTLGLQITARGKGGHSSIPWLADNPVDKLIDGYLRLRQAWTNPTRDDTWKKSMAATILQGSPVLNQIPDSAYMRLHFRLVREEERQEIIDLVKKTTGLEVSVVAGRPPVSLDKDNPELRLFASIVEKHNGKPAEFSRMFGATDACWFLPCGVPIAMFGIEYEGLHAKGERAKLSSFESCAAILKELAQSL